MWRLAAIQFFSMLGFKLWPIVEPFFVRRRAIGLLLFLICLLGMIATMFMGCVTPRSNSIFSLNFSDHAPRAIMLVECNGKKSVHEGVAVCEERTPRKANIDVKIMPVPGRIVYSDGITKKVDDFNYLTEGWWIFKKKKIDTTYVRLDLGELDSIYGDQPLAIDVQGQTHVGIINTRGIIYHRVCNDKDIPCSRLIVDFDCVGSIKNTYEGQIGHCARLSGSSQKFQIKTKTPIYELKVGAKIRVRAARSGWTYHHDIDAFDAGNGLHKFLYPVVLNGPELVQFSVFQWEQGILQEYHTIVLLAGYSPQWTGIDKPHWEPSKREFCMPFTADLLEVVSAGYIGKANSGCVEVKNTASTCAYATDRESGDMTHSCLKNGQEMNLL